MMGIAGILAGMGCTIKVGLPEGEDGVDVADWIEEGVDLAIAPHILANAPV